MAIDLSADPIAIVEHMEEVLAILRRRLWTQGGGLSRDQQTQAIVHVNVLTASLANLKRTLQRGKADGPARN